MHVVDINDESPSANIKAEAACLAGEIIAQFSSLNQARITEPPEVRCLSGDAFNTFTITDLDLDDGGRRC